LTITGRNVGNYDEKYGLFKQNFGIIANLKMDDVTINFAYDQKNVLTNIGAVCGINYGSLDEIDAAGTIYVYRNSSNVGGLVGVNNGSIQFSRFGTYQYISVIEGYGDIGGLAAINGGSARVITCGTQNSIIRQIYIGGDHSTGGLVALNYSVIQNSANSATVIGNGDVGGIAGRNLWATASIELCDNFGTVEYQNSTESRSVGGIVAYQAAGVITGCRNAAAIIYTGPWNESRDLAPKIGQLVGHRGGGSVNGTCGGWVDKGSLHTVTWKGGLFNLVKYSHDQAQYVTNGAVGLN
jgi:hypothetical protein